MTAVDLQTTFNLLVPLDTARLICAGTMFTGKRIMRLFGSNKTARYGLLGQE